MDANKYVSIDYLVNRALPEARKKAKQQERTRIKRIIKKNIVPGMEFDYIDPCELLENI